MEPLTGYSLTDIERHDKGLSTESGRKTHVYHIAYAPEIAKAYIFCWGCNLKCKGCLCLKEINCLALEENLDVVFRDPYLRPPRKPEDLLTLGEVMDKLNGKVVKEVLFEGQEASIDPCFGAMCRRLKEKYSCRIILNTNGVNLPDLSHVDEVVFSLKAVTPKLYQDYTGQDNKEVLQNFSKIYRMPHMKLRAESVFIPDYIDFTETEIIARFIASVDRYIPYRIDAYFEAGDNPWRRATPEEMAKVLELARKHLTTVSCTQQTKRVLSTADLMFKIERLY